MLPISTRPNSRSLYRQLSYKQAKLIRCSNLVLSWFPHPVLDRLGNIGRSSVWSIYFFINPSSQVRSFMATFYYIFSAFKRAMPLFFFSSSMYVLNSHPRLMMSSLSGPTVPPPVLMLISTWKNIANHFICWIVAITVRN